MIFFNDIDNLVMVNMSVVGFFVAKGIFMEDHTRIATNRSDRLRSL